MPITLAVLTDAENGKAICCFVWVGLEMRFDTVHLENIRLDLM